MINYKFIWIGGVVTIIGITVLVIVLARRKSSSPPIVGCSPPCPVGSSCVNNQCVTTTIPCQSDRDCTNHKVCHNPGTAGSSCINCNSSQDCQWTSDQKICYNAGSTNSNCVQCAGNTDCSFPEVCVNFNCALSWPTNGANHITATVGSAKYYLYYEYVTTLPPTGPPINAWVIFATLDKTEASEFTWQSGTGQTGILFINDSQAPPNLVATTSLFNFVETSIQLPTIWTLVQTGDGSYTITYNGNCWQTSGDSDIQTYFPVSLATPNNCGPNRLSGDNYYLQWFNFEPV